METEKDLLSVKELIEVSFRRFDEGKLTNGMLANEIRDSFDLLRSRLKGRINQSAEGKELKVNMIQREKLFNIIDEVFGTEEKIKWNQRKI